MSNTNSKLSSFSTQELINELMYREFNGENLGYKLTKIRDKSQLRPAAKWELKCRMTKTAWKADVHNECITDDDGCGYWGTETEISELDCFWDKCPDNMNYVYWFNK